MQADLMKKVSVIYQSTGELEERKFGVSSIDRKYSKKLNRSQCVFRIFYTYNSALGNIFFNMYCNIIQFLLGRRLQSKTNKQIIAEIS